MKVHIISCLEVPASRNEVHVEIRRRINCGNAWLLDSFLLLLSYQLSSAKDQDIHKQFCQLFFKVVKCDQFL